jgi:aspartate/glutamate racemase
MIELKVVLIHATELAVKPVNTAFQQLWPQARCMNVLDDGLTSDLIRAGSLNDSMVARMVSLAKYSQSAGAHGILYTCSAFGAAIDEAKKTVDLPILKPNEAMFDEALDICETLGGLRRIGLLTTFKPASVTMRDELEVAIRARNLPVQIESACDQKAMDALSIGDVGTHDQLVVDLARTLVECDVLLLGQFSMARSQKLVAEATQKTVLSSPDSAVRRLKSMLAHAD